MPEVTLADIARAGIERKGALIYRMPGEPVAAGGDSHPMNVGIWCGSCGAFLARLGVFALKPAGMNGQLKPHRTAHCTMCHHTSLVVRDASGRESVAQLLKAGRGPTGLCACGGTLSGDEAAKDVEGRDAGGAVGALSVSELQERNRPR